MDGQDQQRPKQEWRRNLRRPTPASLVSVGLHVVIGVLVWNAVQMPAVFDRFLKNDERAKPTVERIQFVTVAPSAPAASQPARAPARRTPPVAQPSSSPDVVPLVAPTEIPRELPAVAATADSVAAGAVKGPLRGGSGSTRGVQPNYDDPRLWVSDLEFYYAPKTYEERLDSALYATLRRHMDSVTANAYSPNKFERGDWTFGKEGSKWGIDQKYIRLGRFNIPTALLALLPLNRMQGNPIAAERDRNAAYMRADIMYHAQAAMNEEQFRKAVAAIRDRKEREKRSRTSAQNPGPMGSPGERPPPN